ESVSLFAGVQAGDGSVAVAVCDAGADCAGAAVDSGDFPEPDRYCAGGGVRKPESFCAGVSEDRGGDADGVSGRAVGGRNLNAEAQRSQSGTITRYCPQNFTFVTSGRPSFAHIFQ